MKLSKFYSNQPQLFEPIYFCSGLNVILAEVRLHKNRKKDTHNLGKTTLGRLLDFCFLSSKNSNFFLFKHLQLFKNFIFFLEIEIGDCSFVTIRRSVTESSKISFKEHNIKNMDYNSLSRNEWNHFEIPFKRAKEILDGLLDFRVIIPWNFRKELGYLLRSQDDFKDVFQLQKFKSEHANWKPFLAHILGFDAKIIKEHYYKEKELEDQKHLFKTIKAEIGSPIDDMSKIDGILLLKQSECKKKQEFIDSFDFQSQDEEKTNRLIDDVDEKIALLNEERYFLCKSKKKIISSLDEKKILFNPHQAQTLFEEAGIFFSGQIKKEFQQLIDFNKEITTERQAYLQHELCEIEDKLKDINFELRSLGSQRSELLSFLSDTDIFNKYKKSTNELVTLRASISSLERQRTYLHRLQELKANIRIISEEKGNLQTQIEKNVKEQNANSCSLFSTIRIFFNEIVEEVIDMNAILSVSINNSGHLEFKAEILDKSGNATSADMGHTYRKLLCVAFDLAITRAYLDKKFPHFIYHDGVFESLDNRKKRNLLVVIRKYTELGIQHIITLIDSDLPAQGNETIFDKDEIVLSLHDESEQGRLFKMPTW